MCKKILFSLNCFVVSKRSSDQVWIIDSICFVLNFFRRVPKCLS
jgi:hypothetical protein